MADSVDSGGGRAAASGADSELDLRALGLHLWRKKLWVIVPTLLVAVAASIVVNVITPRYRSEARLLIEGRENVFLRPQAAEKAIEPSTAVDQEAITSQVQVILSRDLARQVVHELNLGALPEFDPVLNGISPVARILSLLGLVKNPLKMTAEERVLDRYYDRLSVFAVDRSRVIAIEFQSRDPELAARVANAIAETYLTLQQGAKQEQTKAAGAWLAGEIDKLRGKVAQAEAKVEAFRANSNLFVGTNNTTLSNQQLGELNGQLANARAQKADAEARARLIREMLRSGQPLESTDAANSDLIRRLMEQRVTLRAQLAEQSSTLLAQHPRIKELKAQIGDLDGQIRNELERLARTLENDAKVAGARVESINASLDQLKHQAASTNAQDVELRALEREAKAQRELFESYLARFREATARETIAAAPADARIISRAVVSNLPAFPKRLPIVAIATLAMLFASTGVVATGALISGDIYQPVGQPVAAMQRRPGRSEGKRARRAAAAALSAPQPSEPPPGPSIADVASAILRLEEAGKRVAVAGVARNAGTTTTAIALARALARDGKVVLVDLALAAPNLSVISTDPNAPGITDLVGGTASFGSIITRDRFSRVHIVAAGRATANPAGVLKSGRLVTAIDALARSYDHVLIDAGAIADAELAPIARLTPRAVLVVDNLADITSEAARDALDAAGFTDVTLMRGQGDAAPSRPAAA